MSRERCGRAPVERRAASANTSAVRARIRPCSGRTGRIEGPRELRETQSQEAAVVERAAGEHDAAHGRRPRAARTPPGGPWSPVIPVELAPTFAGGDTSTQRINEIEQRAQRIGGEDAVGGVLRWSSVDIGPRARHPHRRAVTQPHHQLRSTARHNVECLPPQRMMPPRHRHARRRGVVRVRSVLLAIHGITSHRRGTSRTRARRTVDSQSRAPNDRARCRAALRDGPARRRRARCPQAGDGHSHAVPPVLPG
jgi:hypothetical protein